MSERQPFLISCRIKKKQQIFSELLPSMLFSFQCYVDTLNTMVTLQNQYLESKNEKNIFHRYNRLRSMVKVSSRHFGGPKIWIHRTCYYNICLKQISPHIEAKVHTFFAFLLIAQTFSIVFAINHECTCALPRTCK